MGQQLHMPPQDIMVSQKSDQEMIPIRKGDVINIRTSFVPAKRSGVITVLKAVGLMAASYQTTQTIVNGTKASTQKAGTNPLPFLGVGAVVSASQLIPKKHMTLYIKSMYYDNNKIFVAEDIEQESKASVNIPYALQITAPADGYLKVFLIDKAKKIVTDLPDLIVNIETPDNKAETENQPSIKGEPASEPIFALHTREEIIATERSMPVSTVAPVIVDLHNSITLIPKVAVSSNAPAKISGKKVIPIAITGKENRGQKNKGY